MKKWKIFLQVLFIGGLSSCAITSGYDPGTSVPLIQDYEILGEVETTMESNVILGFISFGDNNLDARERLMSRNSKADDVVNISVEAKDSRFLGFIFRQVKFVVKGTAIKYKD